MNQEKIPLHAMERDFFMKLVFTLLNANFPVLIDVGFVLFYFNNKEKVVKFFGYDRYS